MQHSRIEWLQDSTGKPGFSINPVKGLCLMNCKTPEGYEYCYARRLYKRFKWNPEIRYVPEVWADLDKVPIGSKVFVCSTFELFLNIIPDAWGEFTFLNVRLYPKLIFIFLTKQPQNLIKFSPYPLNCWIGATATEQGQYNQAIISLRNIEAKVKFISIEPMLGKITILHPQILAKINWLILGSLTQPIRHPQREWVDEILCACEEASVPVFIKEPLASHLNLHRQEMPLIEAGRE